MPVSRPRGGPVSSRPRGWPGDERDGRQVRLRGAGCLRSHGCLRSLTWRFSRGDGAGERSPGPGDKPARPAKGKATGQAMTRTTAMTSVVLAVPIPAGGPELVRRARQGSPGHRVSRGQLLRQQALRTPGRRGADRARVACGASPAARWIPVSPGPVSPPRISPGRRAPRQTADTPDAGRRPRARPRGTGRKVPLKPAGGTRAGPGRRLVRSRAALCPDRRPASHMPASHMPGTQGRHGRDPAHGLKAARATHTSLSLTMPPRLVRDRAASRAQG
jgi:hypothetical protein